MIYNEQKKGNVFVKIIIYILILIIGVGIGIFIDKNYLKEEDKCIKEETKEEVKNDTSTPKVLGQTEISTYMYSIESYIIAATTNVNNNEYGPLTDSSKMYYIPISCIDLTEGGGNPLGDWEAAYVVVHYNADMYSFDYYFTFIDSAGYGMKLIKSDQIKSNGEQIESNKAGLDLDSIVKQKVDGIEQNVVLSSVSTKACSAEEGTIINLNS